MTEKVCPQCGEAKAWPDDFRKSTVNKNRRRSQCNDCHNAANRSYQSQPHVRERERQRNRRFRLAAYNNLTPEAFDLMFSAQQGLCALCGRGGKSRLLVDQSGFTQRVRGLVCDGCKREIRKLEAYGKSHVKEISNSSNTNIAFKGKYILGQ